MERIVSVQCGDFSRSIDIQGKPVWERRFVAEVATDFLVQRCFIAGSAWQGSLPFLKQFRAERNPNALLVYADWLEDRGDPQAEEIRRLVSLMPLADSP